jgi:hypothetical protein
MNAWEGKLKNIKLTSLNYGIFIFLGFILFLSIAPLQSGFSDSVNFDPEINLSSNPSNSINSEIAVSNNDVYVVWRDGNDVFFINSMDGGSTFPFASKDLGDTVSNPHIAVDGDNIYTVWRNSAGIHFNPSNDKGQNFALAVVNVSSDTSTTSNRDPQLTVSSNNDVHVVWRDQTVIGENRILYAKSANNGASFNSIIQLDDKAESFSPDPQITSSGNKLYIVWQDGTNILVAKSPSNGDVFTSIVTAGTTSSNRALPQIAAIGDNVYVTWQDGSEIKFAHSENSGASFASPLSPADGVLGSIADQSLLIPSQIEISGNNVFVVWQDNTINNIEKNGDVKFRKSTDNGKTFAIEKNLSEGGTSTTPKIAASGPNIHVVWRQFTSVDDSDIKHVISVDDGNSFGSERNVSSDLESSEEPSIAISGSTPYIVWTDNKPNGEILFRTGTLSPTSITFDKINYKLGDTANITITDLSSAGNGTISAVVKSSTTEPNTIPITLTETSNGIFTESITFTEDGNSSGTTLKASPGDTITVIFGADEGSSSIFPREIEFDFLTYNLGSTAHLTVNDQNSNTDPNVAETITVEATSTTNPTGISLVLSETGLDTGIFGGVGGPTQSNLIFTEGPGLVSILTQSIIITQIDGNNTNGSNADPTKIDAITVTITSTSDPSGISLTLNETDVNTAIFSGELLLSTLTSDNSTGAIKIAAGDVITTTNKESLSSKLLVVPAPIQNGALDVATPEDLNIQAIFKGANTTVELDDPFAPGGGGGGLVRPSLVVNALAGIGGGGSAYSSPTLQLGNLVQLGQIDVPLEVEQMILDHDSTKPVPAMELNYFEDFTYPLRINDKGFVLSGFSTTLETQTLETNMPHTFKFLFYESDKIQHFSLYTNLRDANTEIYQSDTQILYNDGLGTEVVDPNGFFENVSLAVNEIDDLKKEVVLEITFANTMDTTDMIVRSWDPFLNSFDTYILDAITVVSDENIESPITTYEEPIIEQLSSTTIPIWIKNNAAWWSDQQISDSDFVEGIEYLIKNRIINVPGVEVGATSTSEIPDWIKNNAGWWSESLITDDDFIQAMQWLVANGVIQI